MVLSQRNYPLIMGIYGDIELRFSTNRPHIAFYLAWSHIKGLLLPLDIHSIYQPYMTYNIVS